MTNTEISLVQASWKKLRGIQPHVIGDVFYSKLFLEAPYLKPLFKTTRPEQSVKLVSMLNVIVARLEHLDTLKNDIRQMAIRHQRYGVKTSHYDLVGLALLWTLEKGLGNDWNEPVKNAWLKCYSVLAATMIAATENKLNTQ